MHGTGETGFVFFMDPDDSQMLCGTVQALSDYKPVVRQSKKFTCIFGHKSDPVGPKLPNKSKAYVGGGYKTGFNGEVSMAQCVADIVYADPGGEAVAQKDTGAKEISAHLLRVSKLEELLKDVDSDVQKRELHKKLAFEKQELQFVQSLFKKKVLASAPPPLGTTHSPEWKQKFCRPPGGVFLDHRYPTLVTNLRQFGEFVSTRNERVVIFLTTPLRNHISLDKHGEPFYCFVQFFFLLLCGIPLLFTFFLCGIPLLFTFFLVFSSCKILLWTSRRLVLRGRTEILPFFLFKEPATTRTGLELKRKKTTKPMIRKTTWTQTSFQVISSFQLPLLP